MYRCRALGVHLRVRLGSVKYPHGHLWGAFSGQDRLRIDPENHKTPNGQGDHSHDFLLDSGVSPAPMPIYL